ncbi:MAG: phage adsorption protein NrfB [Candidatus Eremiobacteraeota bacterium]|nr:phage adsorption protein NrfB [Candidatus Eremiobacteraeota bacterium]
MNVPVFTFAFSQAIAALVIASAFAFTIFGADDLFFDLAYWVHKIVRWWQTRLFKALSLEKLREKDQQRIAVFVACWHEADVVEKMAELTCRSIQYKNYDLFIGVYPNDPETIDRAEAAARRFRRVKVVVNPQPGPTTKAQNLNSMYAELKRLEGDNPYKIVVMHDVEDVIHPYSLLLYNFLIPRRDMVQLPVFPLEREWNKWTAWTYADEFAENHLKDMVIREALASWVPCAGVGCGFNRAALDHVGDNNVDIFPASSLTEDYQLGLRFREHGFSTIMVHQRLTHEHGKEYDLTAGSYVATREFFPDTFWTAVRQKTRWIAGICFQAWAHTGWTGDLFTRYTLYRDRKAVAANLLVLVGYVALVCSLGLAIWHLIDSRVFQPQIGAVWWVWAIINFVFVMTVIRIMQKLYFVSSIYGGKQGFLALLRIPWSAIINAVATARACYIVAHSAITGQPIVWSKTDHVFPTDTALREYRRQLGEVLVEEELVSSDDIAVALGERLPGERIGQTLVRLGYLTQRQLVGAVAKQIGATDGIEDDLITTREALDYLKHEEALHYCVLPLRVEEGFLLVAVSDEPSNELDAFLIERSPIPYRIVLVENARLVHAIERSYSFGDARRKPLGVFMLDKGLLDRDQLDDLLKAQDKAHKPLFQTMVEQKLLSEEKIAVVLREYFELEYVEPARRVHIPVERVAHIPHKLLEDNHISLYEREDGLVLASPFPISKQVRQAVEDAVGSVHQAGGSLAALTGLRNRMFRELKAHHGELIEEPVLAAAPEEPMLEAAPEESIEVVAALEEIAREIAPPFAEPEVEPEISLAEFEAVAEPEPVAELEPVAQLEPVAEFELVPEPEPVVELAEIAEIAEITERADVAAIFEIAEAVFAEIAELAAVEPPPDLVLETVAPPVIAQFVTLPRMTRPWLGGGPRFEIPEKPESNRPWIVA